MKQTITINVPAGKKAVYDEVTQTVKFVEPIRSKSWEEFCENHPEINEEYYIDSEGNIDINRYNSSRKCYNNLATKEDAEGILALIQLTRLHDEWVGDWKPSKDDRSEVICGFDYGNEYDICTQRALNRHSLLIFPNSDMAQEFLDCFEDLINKAKRFI